MKRSVQWYGWRPDHPGPDPKFNHEAVSVTEEKLDWWQKLRVPPVKNQGAAGTCVAHGTGRAIALAAIRLGLPLIDPCRLQIYWDARAIEGATDVDDGSEIRDAILAGVTLGIAPESYYPYNEKFVTTAPPKSLYVEADKRHIIAFERVINTEPDAVIKALQVGPVIYGISLQESFESAQVEKTGIYMPRPSEDIVGGHCMLLSGYDVSRVGFPYEYVFSDNSWDTSWGINGRCIIPLSIITDGDWCDDFWLIRKIT